VCVCVRVLYNINYTEAETGKSILWGKTARRLLPARPPRKRSERSSGIASESVQRCRRRDRILFYFFHYYYLFIIFTPGNGRREVIAHKYTIMTLSAAGRIYCGTRAKFKKRNYLHAIWYAVSASRLLRTRVSAARGRTAARFVVYATRGLLEISLVHPVQLIYTYVRARDLQVCAMIARFRCTAIYRCVTVINRTTVVVFRGDCYFNKHLIELRAVWETVNGPFISRLSN